MTLSAERPPSRHAAYTLFDRMPYWLLAATLIGIFFVWKIMTDETYTRSFAAVSKGIWVTIWVTAISFTGAMIVGLLVALARVSHNRVIYEVATFYVEIIRGIPMLVLLLYIAFVVAPAMVLGLNWIGRQLIEWGLVWLGQPMVSFRIRDLGYAGTRHHRADHCLQRFPE